VYSYLFISVVLALFKNFTFLFLSIYYYFHIAGKYGILTPFYNGQSSGKTGRFNIYKMNDIQEVNLKADRTNPGIYFGYRGGFTNNWSGLEPEHFDL